VNRLVYLICLERRRSLIDMPRNRRSKSSNEHQTTTAKKLKEKPTYKIIVLGSGGVGKVSFLQSHKPINH
jgi:GTPase SAR1 family protein